MATVWLRCRDGKLPVAVGMGSGIEAGVVRVDNTCQESGWPTGRILVGAGAGDGVGATSVGAGPASAPEGVGTASEGAMGISASGAVKW